MQNCRLIHKTRNKLANKQTTTKHRCVKTDSKTERKKTTTHTEEFATHKHYNWTWMFKTHAYTRAHTQNEWNDGETRAFQWGFPNPSDSFYRILFLFRIHLFLLAEMMRFEREETKWMTFLQWPIHWFDQYRPQQQHPPSLRWKHIQISNLRKQIIKTINTFCEAAKTPRGGGETDREI